MIGIAADIGGTHARFASVGVSSSGHVELRHVRTLSAIDFPDFEGAFGAFAADLPERPRVAALALASPITGEHIKLTNSSWTITPAAVAQRLQLDRVLLLNDFEAIARSLAAVPATAFTSIGGGDFTLPRRGAISVVGPGSGLGVSMLLRAPTGDHVVANEGGHAGFSPGDEVDWHIMGHLIAKHGRASAERVVSGPGLLEIYTVLAQLQNSSAPALGEIAVWTAALEGSDALAGAALERWLTHLGSFAGDVALTHGAGAVVLAGGILPRLAGRIGLTPITRSFCDKGRFANYMGKIGFALLTHPQPGLIGAASLLVQEAGASRSLSATVAS